MFKNCSNLSSLPDISKWNTESVETIVSIFSRCSSLIFLPDISKWNFKNIKAITFLFPGCSSLVSLPDIFNWPYLRDLKVDYMHFIDCFSIINIPKQYIGRKMSSIIRDAIKNMIEPIFFSQENKFNNFFFNFNEEK